MAVKPAMDISKRDIKQLHSYVERMHTLLDDLSMDEDAKHFIDDELLDRHYQIRDLAETMFESIKSKGELY